MPTLNDPTFTKNHLYYAFVTNLSNQIDTTLRTITQNDIFVNYVDCQPIVSNQDVEMVITNREGVSITSETENLVRAICYYLYNRTVQSYSDMMDCKNIYLNIKLEDILVGGKGSKLTGEVLKNPTVEDSLVYNVSSNTEIDEDALRYRFILGYYPEEQSWSLDDHTKEYIKDYNEWFKTNTLDVATAQLISSAKQLVERI